MARSHIGTGCNNTQSVCIIQENKHKLCSVVDKKAILGKIRSHYGFSTNAEFADFLGIKPNVLSNWFARGTFDYNVVFTKCEDIDGNWLLSGVGEMIRTTKEASCQSDHTDKKLFDAQQKIIAMLEAENERLKKELEAKSINRALPADLEYGRKYKEHSQSGK